MRKFIVIRDSEDVFVALMKHKEENKYSYVNLSKGYICSCKFDTEEDAIKDMGVQIKQGKILGYMEVRV